MRKHRYEAVIQEGRVGMVVQYASWHRKGSRANKCDLMNEFGRIYKMAWPINVVIHEWKTIG